jgi:hypothetical protein
VEHASAIFVPADIDGSAEALRYPVQAGGTRLRPVLCLASAEAAAPLSHESAEQARKHALYVACAIELIHTCRRARRSRRWMTTLLARTPGSSRIRRRAAVPMAMRY